MNRKAPLFLPGSVLGVALLLSCTGRYVRSTTDEPVRATPERIARGEYVVNQLTSCGACHTTRESLLHGESAEGYLAGGNVIRDGDMRLWVPNITPDDETGIGRWSDDEIMRAIRDGVGRHGELFIPLMPFNSYRYMSDEDLRSVVAYLRTVPPVKQTRPRIENALPFPVRMARSLGFLHQKPVSDVPPPDVSTPEKRGEYVVRMGHCWECHSLGKTGPRNSDDDGYMAGSDRVFDLGLGKVWATNLTPHPETGLGKISDEQLADMLRTGKRRDGSQVAPPMSWFTPHISGLSEEDMNGLIAYLRALPPVEKEIPPRALNADGKRLVGEPVSVGR